MPSILSDNDKETVKRTVPKASNKIQAVAVARLYVAHPNRNRWTYTGLQGAAVLSNDLVGNTFWIKLVDISPANRGVIWDQEIYDTFQYNQDRTFFHSFELEQCMAGLSFMDEKEARTFKKKMDEREKNASKGTKVQPFGFNNAGGALPNGSGGGGKNHGRFSNFLHGHRHSSNPTIPQQAPQSTIPPRQPVYDSGPTSRPVSTSSDIDLTDPSWRPILDELLQMGISEEQIANNADFIKQYVQQKQAEQIAGGVAEALPAANRAKAPPPPPPALPSSVPSRISPQNTGVSTTSNRRGPPPAPPPSRRPVGGRSSSPPPRASTPPRTPSPEPSPQPQFKVPPPLANAGKFAVTTGRAMHPSGRDRSSSGATLPNPGPPPPPRPPKTPMEEDSPPHQFRVPPPFTGERKPVPTPAPARGPIPPPPPSRDTPSAGSPPPLPPKQTASSSAHSVAPSTIPPPPPPPPGRSNVSLLPTQNARPIPPPPSSENIPPPPPLPSSNGPPPPPPLPSSGGPPPAPPLPGTSSSSAPPLPRPAAGGENRDGLLAAIRGTGGGGLRKVKDSEKRDRSAAAIPGAESSAPPPPPGPGGAPPGGDAQGGLAGALAAALSQRKKKVSGSDDEKDDDDDW